MNLRGGLGKNLKRKDLRGSLRGGLSRSSLKKGQELGKGYTSSNRRSVRIKRMDKKFSLYVRHSHASPDETVRCYTCKSALPLKKIDCGHYISRRFEAVRWDEANGRPQCHTCNRFLDGNLEEYRRQLIAEIGPVEFHELEERKKTERFNYTDDELQEIEDRLDKLLEPFNLDL